MYLFKYLLPIFIFPCLAASAVVPQQNVSHKVNLPSGELIVVSEGDGEPRSIGSYSLRVYSVVNAEYPYDDFVAGAVFSRNGSVEKITLYDLDNDGADEIVVIMRSAGSGNYLAMQAIGYDGQTLERLLTVDGVDKGAEPVQVLQAELTKLRSMD